MRRLPGFTRAIQVIRQDYVDRNAVSYKKLTYAALHAMLPHLDPHSQFLEPEDLKDREDETRGEFGGFGFTISRKEQSVTVLSTMENSPSARAGILPGDQIVAVGGKSTLNMPIEDLNQMLRGQPNQRLGADDLPAFDQRNEGLRNATRDDQSRERGGCENSEVRKRPAASRSAISELPNSQNRQRASCPKNLICCRPTECKR